MEVESEGEFDDTCVLVHSASSSSIYGASVWRELREEHWCWSGLVATFLPGAYFLKNLWLGVCPYPVWRADGWQLALISSFRLCLLHCHLMSFDLGRGKEKEARRDG